MERKHQQNRRKFIKSGIAFGAVLGTSRILGNTSALFAGESSSIVPDLVAVRNGEPEKMFKMGIEAMGGMKQFVKKGQTVLVKPNIGFNKTPEIGATTNPTLVKAVIESCLHAGAKKVYLFDNVAASSYGVANECYRNSGIEDAAKDAGALVAPGDVEKYYQDVRIEGAELLGSTKVHELLLESDVFINVPIIKNHRHTRMTGAMKNLMGVVWDRMTYHFSGLDQCIADFCLYRKPDLNIMDGYRVLMKNGPRGQSKNDVALRKMLLVSRDIVAIDAAAARIYGEDPANIKYIKMGHDLKCGNMNLDKLQISRLVA